LDRAGQGAAAGDQLLTRSVDMARTKSPKKTKTKSGKLQKKRSTVSKSAKAQVVQKGQVDLGTLFESALGLLAANKQQVNALDGYNGNHGDNMVQNVQLIVDALKGTGSKSPSKALQSASQSLQSQGKGGTSQYYAQGLQQAANQFEGKKGLDLGDIVPLIQTVLGAIPSQGHPTQASAGGTVLDQIAGLGQPQTAQAPKDDGLDLGDVLTTLLPAGLSYMQAKKDGAGTAEAAGQALIGTLLGGQSNPLQTGTPRSAAGGLIAQALLQAVTGRS
jgi:hypothetical protein